MQRINFLVQGSSEEPYNVTFEHAGTHLRAFCTCAAGEAGQSCKHRINILSGSIDGIVSPNANDVSVAASWLKGSDLSDLIDAVDRAERQLEIAKKMVSSAKKAVGALMRSPLPKDAP